MEGASKDFEDGDEIVVPSRQPAFVVSIFRFQEAIDAVRQLHDEVCGHAAELDRKHARPEQLSSVKSLSDDRRKKFEVWLAARLEESSDGPGQAGIESALLSDEHEQELNEIFSGNLAAIGQVQLMLQRAILAPSREMLLRSSLLTMAVSSFEVLIGDLAARHYERRPGDLGNGKRFSFLEIAEYESLWHLQDAAIAHRVYELLQAPLDEWVKWLDKDSGLGIKLKNLAIDFDTLAEIVQRRHVVIHNGGAVSAQYLDKVEFSGPPPAIGTPLPIDEEYLRTALDHLDCLGNLIGVGVWSKERPELEPHAIAVLSNRMEQLLFEGKWVPLRQICSVGKKIAKVDLQHQIFKVNEWLAIKNLEGLTEIEDEIRRWDTSAIGTQFQVVQLALLNEAEAFFTAAPRALETGGIHKVQLKIWPVFDDLRADGRFATLLAGEQTVE